MKGTTKYVALDVHQATTVASVREGGGRVIARSIFPTEESAIPRGLPARPSGRDPEPPVFSPSTRSPTGEGPQATASQRHEGC